MQRRLLFAFSLVIAGFLVFSRATYVSASWLLDSDGQLYFESGSVLGKKDTNPGRGAAVKSNKSETPPGKDEEKTKGKPVMVEPTTNRVKINNKGGKLRVDFLNQDATTSEGTPSGEFDVEDDGDSDVTTVRAHGKAALIIRNKVAAQTKFPLMVDLETNELIVTTPKGEKAVTVLPDKALENMLAANVLDQLGGKGGLKWLEYQASLATDSGVLVASESGDLVATDSGQPVATDSGEPTATGSGELSRKVTICHATGSETNPWVKLTISRKGWESGHKGKHQKNGRSDYLVDADGDGVDEVDCTLSGDRVATDSADLAPIATESGEPTEPATSSATPPPPAPPEEEAPITLTTDDDGTLVYEIDGIKSKKLFNLFRIELKRRVRVSAETGELMDIDQDLWNRILEVLSTDI